MPSVAPISSPPSPSGPFFGWRVVAGVFVMATFGWGFGFYGPPIYLFAVRAARGWSLDVVSAAVTVHFLVGALAVVNLPAAHRRFGVPAVTKAGAVLLALGVLGWAMAASPWQLFGATILSGTGWVALGAAAVNAIVSPWFVVRRPAALGMAYNGASLGGIVFSPLWVAAIGTIGFPAAAAAIGAVMVATVWLLSDRLFGLSPDALGLAPDGAHRGASPAPARPAGPPIRLVRDRRFLTLSAATAFGLFAQIGLIAHLFSLLVPALGPGAAGLAMGGATAAAILGRTLVGWAMPASADRRLVACASYGVQIAGSAAFLLADGVEVRLLMLGIALFGAGIGNATSLPPLIAQAEFPRSDVPRAVALTVAIGQAAYAFAPLAFGLLRAGTAGTESGAAPWFFAAAALIQALAIAALLAGRRGRLAEPAA